MNTLTKFFIPLFLVLANAALTGPACATTTLTASPNPCPVFAGDLCTALVSWQSSTLTQIWVQKDTGAQALFACGSTGSQQAPWIASGASYIFSAYKATSCAASGRTGPVLNSLTVKTVPLTLTNLAPWMSSTMGFGNASYALPSMAQSPASAAAGDVSEQFVAPDGQTVTVTVKSPVTTKTYNAPAITPGESPIDYFSQQIQNAGSGSTLVIPKGTYNFPAVNCSATASFVCAFATHVLVNSMHDMVIDGQESTLNFQSDYNGIRINNSQRIVIKNFTIDWPNLQNAALGTVVASGYNFNLQPPGYSYDLQVPAGSNVAGGFTAATAWDSTNNYWSLNQPWKDIYTAPLPPFVFSPAGLVKNVPSFAVQMKVGEQLLVRHFGISNGVFDIGSQDVTMDNITVNTAPILGFMITVGRGVHLNNCTVTRSNGRPISTAADAVHFGSFGGDVIIENSKFAYQGDDGLNIHTFLMPVASMPSCGGPNANCPSVLPYDFFTQNGDTVALFDPSQSFVSKQTAVCVNGACTVNIAPIAASGGFAADMNQVNARFIIRNNIFEHNRARGALLQTPYGLLEGNTFVGQTLHSLHLVSSAYWYEGPGAQNVLILDNKISNSGNSGQAAVTLGTENSNSQIIYTKSSLPRPPATQQNIIFAGNIINNIPGSAFYMSSANNAVLYDNSITDTDLNSDFGALEVNNGLPDKNYPVVVEDASNILISDNTFSNTTSPVSSDGTDVNIRVNSA